MEALLALTAIVLGLVALASLGAAFGVDSRDGLRQRPDLTVVPLNRR